MATKKSPPKSGPLKIDWQINDGRQLSLVSPKETM